MDVLPAGEIAAPDIQLEWASPPQSVDLPGEDVHVWSASLLDPGLEPYAKGEMLSPSEQERSAKFHFERDRRSFVVRRSLLRAILGVYLKIEAVQVPLVYEQWGKPKLAAREGTPPLHFNFSHSRGLAVCAVSGFGVVGVDVEKLRPMPEMAEISATFCSPPENAQIKAAPAEMQVEAFFGVWTRKEAFLKANGQGLVGSLASVDCSAAPPDWTLQTFSPAPGFVGSLAFPGRAGKVQCWRWECPSTQRPV
jgi:4'-phosphopantetheinyl transferase